jgi:phospholipase C
LTSIFLPAAAGEASLPKPVDRNPFVVGIHQAQFRPNPASNAALTAADIESLRKNPRACGSLPRQESGTRPSCALPYELHVTGRFDRDRRAFAIEFEARNKKFAARAAGAPFNVYAPGKYAGELMRMWSYAVGAGHVLKEDWPLSRFESGVYHLRVHGPNGFYREFQGAADDPALTVTCDDQIAAGKPTGNLVLQLSNHSESGTIHVEITDHAYGAARQSRTIAPAESATIDLDLQKSFHWHDFSVTVRENKNYLQRFAGRVETGNLGTSDPSMA